MQNPGYLWNNWLELLIGCYFEEIQTNWNILNSHIEIFGGFKCFMDINTDADPLFLPFDQQVSNDEQLLDLIKI